MESIVGSSDMAWEVVERFAHLAPSWKTMDDLINQGLRAVTEAIRADVVYWSGSESEEVRQTGNRKLTSSLCQEFTRRFLEETPGVERQLLRTHLLGFGFSEAAPVSAALVRISRSKGI